MINGVKITDMELGNGLVAERAKAVVVHIRGFLNRGEEFWNTYNDGRPVCLNLSKRAAISGLNKGIEGMRVGGKRQLVVSPHLAYGEAGLPGKVPANAVIRFEVELVDVREANAPLTDLWPAGKHLTVIYPGESARNLARWQYVIREEASVAGALITLPLPGMTWRHARTKDIEVKMDPKQVQQLFESVQSTMIEHPKACLQNDEMWADASEKANSATRDQKTNALCVTVSIFERGTWVMNFGLPENSPVLLNSFFYQTIMSAIEPHLKAIADEIKKLNDIKPSNGGCRLP